MREEEDVFLVDQKIEWTLVISEVTEVPESTLCPVGLWLSLTWNIIAVDATSEILSALWGVVPPFGFMWAWSFSEIQGVSSTTAVVRATFHNLHYPRAQIWGFVTVFGKCTLSLPACCSECGFALVLSDHTSTVSLTILISKLSDSFFIYVIDNTVR